MTQLHRTSGAGAVPANDDGTNEWLAYLLSAIDTIAGCYYGTTDPSSGNNWGAEHRGFTWFDSGGAKDEGGDNQGIVIRRWEVLTSTPTYGWRVVSWRSLVAKEPNVNALDLSGESTSAGWVDLDVNSDTDKRAVAVLLQVEVEDSGTPSSSVYAEFRKNGTTGDVRARRVYPQASGVPNMIQLWVELDADQTLEYFIHASGANTFDLRIDILAYHERS